MWVFFCVLLVVFVLMFGPFCLELKNKRGRERFFEVSLRFCGLCIYQGVFMLHFKHVVRPQIIKVKKAGFKKIYAATIQKSKKKRGGKKKKKGEKGRRGRKRGKREGRGEEEEEGKEEEGKEEEGGRGEGGGVGCLRTKTECFPGGVLGDWREKTGRFNENTKNT